MNLLILSGEFHVARPMDPGAKLLEAPRQGFRGHPPPPLRQKTKEIVVWWGDDFPRWASIQVYI